MRSTKWIVLAVVLGVGLLWLISPDSEVATPVHAVRPSVPCSPPDGGNCCCWGFTPAGYKCGSWTAPVADAQECQAHYTGGEVPGCPQTDQAACKFVDQ